MNFSILKWITILFAMLSITSCSLDLFGHSKNGVYFGMGQSTNGMSGKTYIPKKIQREEPLF